MRDQNPIQIPICLITRKSGISSNSSLTVYKGSNYIVRVLSLSLHLSILVLCVVASWTLVGLRIWWPLQLEIPVDKKVSSSIHIINLREAANGPHLLHPGIPEPITVTLE